MATQTYWLAGPDGVLASVDGAAERDRLIPQGWTLAGEIRPSDQVWCHHPETGGWAKFAFEVLPVFEARGWVPTPPPLKEGDVGHFVELPPPGAPVVAELKADAPPEPEPEPIQESTEAAAAPSPKSKKENDRA